MPQLVPKILILIAALSLPLGASASNQCYSAFQDQISDQENPSLQINMNDSSGLLGEQDYRSHLSSISEVLDGLTIPAITLNIESAGTTAVALFSDRAIHISNLFTKYASGKSNHPKHSLGILSHEFGHLVFEENMNLHSPLFKQRREKGDKGHEMYRRLLVLEEKINQRPANPQATDASAFIVRSPQFYAVKRMQKRIQRRYSAIWRFQDSIPSAYHELFADMVSVIHSQDPRVIFNATHGNVATAGFSSQRDVDWFNRTKIQYRDFEMTWGTGTWKQWERDVSAYYQGYQFHSGYMLFAPARAELWKMIRYRVKNPAQQKLLLADVFDVLRQHYELNFQSIEAAHSLNPTELNLSLIRLFEERWS